jgi:hypothetical protein
MVKVFLLTVLFSAIGLLSPSAGAVENEILWFGDQTGVCRDDNGEYPRWSDYNWSLSECQTACGQNSNCQGFAMSKTANYCQLFGSDGAHSASLPGTTITRGDSSQPGYTCYLKREGMPCTTCDDPADVGSVLWCNANPCIPAQDVVPHTTPGLGGYCPSIVGRAAAENIDITTCSNVNEDTLSDGVKLWYTECGADRIVTSSTSHCAYVLDADTGAKNEIQKQAFTSRYGLFSPTSQVYKVPDEADLWYQFFEHGVVINSADGTTAHAMYQSNRWPVKERWKQALQAGEVEAKKLYPIGRVEGSGNDKRIAYFTGTGTPPSAAIVSLNRVGRGDPGYLIEGDLLSKYKDYDQHVDNPDLFSGYLGVPISERACGDSACTREYQSFQNGIITTDGEEVAVAPSMAQACKSCDDASEGLSDDSCQTELNATDCTGVAGCTWDASHSVCRGTAQAWCSPNPGDFICPVITARAACKDQSGCTWINNVDKCRSSAPTGAIGQRIADKGWPTQNCSGLQQDSYSGDYVVDCSVGGEVHRVQWGQDTQCAYVLWGGNDARSKLRAKWESLLTSWKANTVYSESNYRENNGNVYECAQSGTSAASGPGPVGTDPSVDIVDGTVKWRYVKRGKTIGAVLGTPTSEAREIGTGNWVQYFENGVIVLPAGRSFAAYFGDPSPGGLAIKRRFREAEQSGELLAAGFWPYYTPNNTVGGRTMTFFKGTETGLLMAPHGGAGHMVLGDFFDQYNAAGNYGGDLGWPISDRVHAGSFDYQLFEGGVVTDLGGTLRVVRSEKPSASYWKDDRLHNVRQPFCVASNADRALAMEMRRLSLGWGDWISAESSYTYIYTTYYRSTPEGKVIFTNDTGSGSKCSFYLRGKLEAKWDSWSYQERANYGYLSSGTVDVLDDDGNYAGEYVFLRNGAIIYRHGDAEAYALGSSNGSGIPGYGLKEKFRSKAEAGVIHAEGYFLKRDAYAGTSSSCGNNACWIAEFHGDTTNDPQGIRFYTSSVAASCGLKTEDQCKRTSHQEGTPHCMWNETYGQCILGAHEVRGDWNAKYSSYGSGNTFDDGYLGIPMTDVVCSNADCSSKYQNFEGGSIYTTAAGFWSVSETRVEPCPTTCSETNDCRSVCNDVDTFVRMTCANAGLCPACSASVCPTDGTGMEIGYRPFSVLCMSNRGLENCIDWNTHEQGDADLDGIPDALEQELAEKFAPRLVAALMDMTQLYGFQHERAACPGSDPQCQLPFVIREYRNAGGGWLDCSEAYRCLEIQYSLAYNGDFGDKAISDGIKAIFGAVPIIGGLAQSFVGGPLGQLDPIAFEKHPGDPEHMAVLIARQNPFKYGASWGASYSKAKTDVDYWRLVAKQASSHRCTAADSTHWWQWGPWQGSQYPKTASTHAADRDLLFVAKRKHASYFTRSRCDRGAFGLDNCHEAKERYLFDFPTDALVNVGEKTRAEAFDTKIAFSSDSARQRAGGAFGLFDVWTGKNFGKSSSIEKVLRPGATNWEARTLYCPE